MDNLTPRKIERLLNIAEDVQLSSPEKRLLADRELNLIMSQIHKESTQQQQHYESSSGVFDLDQLQGMEEFENISPSLCTTFNPVEITGRSTGANVSDPLDLPDVSGKGLTFAGILESQSTALPDLMRHSIAVDMSFQSKRDLSADEASLIAREVGLPNPQATYTINEESQPPSLNNTNVSMGSYFQRRCAGLSKVLGNTDSPDRSYMMPSITEVSQTLGYELGKSKVDDSLDCIPVRQSRQKAADNLFKIPPPVESKQSLKPESSRIPKLGHRSFMSSSKPADVLLKNLHTSFRQMSDDTEGDENSLSLSRIAEFIGKQSNVSITDILQLNKKKTEPKNQPLTEIDMNQIDQEVHVTNLKDTKRSDTASSTGTMNTVLPMEKLKISTIPEVLITSTEQFLNDEIHSKRATRSKSPSSKSQSTATTVKDNYSFRSGHSPAHNSPDQWAEIVSPAVEGFVGVSCPITIKVTTLTDSWLTAKFQFDDLPESGKDLTIELQRLPLLLSPGKSEQFTVHITAHAEMNVNLPFTVLLKDTSIDEDIPQRGNVQVNFKLPVIQAMSVNGLNKIAFPPILEKRTHMTSFVLLSDCPEDLQLELFIAERETLFNIVNVLEVKKTDVNKHLMEANARQSAMKSKAKQLCRLVKGNAIKVVVVFNAPKLSDEQRSEPNVIFKGALNVNLIGVNTVLKKVELIGIVGTPILAVDPSGKLHIANEPTTITVQNTGSITGVWRVKSENVPFRMHPETYELAPGAGMPVKLSYNGPEDCVTEGYLVIQEIATSKKTKLHLTGGSDKPKFEVFPIKTNYSIMSFVRAGRKEMTLINTSEKKIQIRCMVEGDGFMVDKIGMESRKVIGLTFAPLERRTISVVFCPNTNRPYSTMLKLSFDRNEEFCRKIFLHGCACAGAARWWGLATYGDTALVRAVVRAPVDLRLHNKAPVPAFVCARVRYNLHYSIISSTSSITGARSIVPARGSHRIELRVDWARLERRARLAPAPPALATLTVLTGAETTRRRILRIIRNESTGELDKLQLPENLRPLADEFENEDPSIDDQLKDFRETKVSLEDLVDGIEELTAQVDLPQDFADENNTILITDETVMNFHTLCE